MDRAWIAFGAAVLLLVSGAEWTAEAWAQRASADDAYNAEVRNRMANPLEFPVGAAIGIGILGSKFLDELKEKIEPLKEKLPFFNNEEEDDDREIRKKKMRHSRFFNNRISTKYEEFFFCFFFFLQ